MRDKNLKAAKLFTDSILIFDPKVLQITALGPKILPLTEFRVHTWYILLKTSYRQRHRKGGGGVVRIKSNIFQLLGTVKAALHPEFCMN